MAESRQGAGNLLTQQEVTKALLILLFRSGEAKAGIPGAQGQSWPQS